MNKVRTLGLVLVSATLGSLATWFVLGTANTVQAQGQVVGTQSVWLVDKDVSDINKQLAGTVKQSSQITYCNDHYVIITTTRR